MLYKFAVEKTGQKKQKERAIERERAHQRIQQFFYNLLPFFLFSLSVLFLISICHFYVLLLSIPLLTYFKFRVYSHDFIKVVHTRSSNFSASGRRTSQLFFYCCRSSALSCVCVCVMFPNYEEHEQMLFSRFVSSSMYTRLSESLRENVDGSHGESGSSGVCLGVYCWK